MDLLRQQDLVRNPNTPIHVVGAGSVGSWVTTAIAKMGYKDITIYDGDKIEGHNTPNHLYPDHTVGVHKVTALADMMRDLTGSQIKPVKNFIKTIKTQDKAIVIFTTDKMSSRVEIAKNLAKDGKNIMVIDTRTLPDAFQVMAFEFPKEHKDFEATTFSDDEAVELPCTAKSIVITPMMVAGEVAEMVRRVSNGEPIRKKFQRTLYLEHGVPQ